MGNLALTWIFRIDRKPESHHYTKAWPHAGGPRKPWMVLINIILIGHLTLFNPFPTYQLCGGDLSQLNSFFWLIRFTFVIINNNLYFVLPLLFSFSWADPGCCYTGAGVSWQPCQVSTSIPYTDKDDCTMDDSREGKLFHIHVFTACIAHQEMCYYLSTIWELFSSPFFKYQVLHSCDEK